MNFKESSGTKQNYCTSFQGTREIAPQVLLPQSYYIPTAQTVNIWNKVNKFECDENFKFKVSAKYNFFLQYL